MNGALIANQDWDVGFRVAWLDRSGTRSEIADHDRECRAFNLTGAWCTTAYYLALHPILRTYALDKYTEI